MAPPLRNRTVTPDPQAVDAGLGSDRVGLLIIRAWAEPGSSHPLRAHLRLSSDVSAGFERALTLATPEDVVAAVHEWLAEIMLPATPGDESPA